MKIILIAAMNQDRVIGKDGALPWHIPDDLKFFKRTTIGHAVIMGRKTFDSIGKPLPKRRNLVITRQHGFSISSGGGSASHPPDDRANTVLFGVEEKAAVDGRNESSLRIVHSLDEAIDNCKQVGEAFAFVIGGAQIYSLAMPVADEMLITHVDMPGIDGDAFFPEWDADEWRDADVADESFALARRYVRR